MKTKELNILLFLLGIFVSILVASNAGGSKLMQFGSLTASATVVSYALSFLVTDIVSEVWGKKMAQRFIVIGLFTALISVLFFLLVVQLPAADVYQDQEAFAKVFNYSWRLLLGGFTAFMVSQYIDVHIFHFVKKLTKGRMLWLRNNLSTLISQFIDTIIFITIAFYGSFDILPLIAGQYILKIGIAILDTPIIYVMIYLINNYLSIDERDFVGGIQL